MSVKYQGSCHCGAVAYEAVVDTVASMTCNCSMCGRSGTILSFIPAADFSLLRGEDHLADYQFHKKHIHHVFCTTCGIKPFAYGNGEDGSLTYAINLRCLEGLDLDTLTPQPVDGRSL